MKRQFSTLLYSLSLTTVLLTTSCQLNTRVSEEIATAKPSNKVVNITSPKVKQLVEAGLEQTKYTRFYDPAYVSLSYPGGDVPLERGVCTDVVVRAFRKLGIDLQKEVHEDMRQSFSVYPQMWNLKKPDRNIDHRRVPNLMTYFKRQGKALAITNNKEAFLPGDVVAWDLGYGQQHIGIVSNRISSTTGNPLIIHNISSGTKEEDILFSWKIIGHYRYFK